MAERPDASLDAAVEQLRRGGLVAVPTETVYGLAALADDDAALRSIFRLKGRPADHPLILHLGDASWLDEFTVAAPPAARTLAERFWPGPLTLVLKRSARVSLLVTGGLDTVAVRVPAHPLTRDLLSRLGRPIAAPSANRFGGVSPTRPEHVRTELGDDVMVLDGGPCDVGVESTIVDLTASTPSILRPGGVSREALEAVLEVPVPVATDSAVRAPGTLASHYAPHARVVIVDRDRIATEARRRTSAGARVGVLAPRLSELELEGAESVELPEDAEAAARMLYAALRELDARGVGVILSTLPPEEGLGVAVADRLRRASAPRDGAP